MCYFSCVFKPYLTLVNDIQRIWMIFVLILKFDDISWYFNGFQMVSTCFNYLPWFSFIFHYFSVFGPPHYPTRTLVARKEGKEKQWRERQNWIGEPPWCRLWSLDGMEWFGWILNGFETFWVCFIAFFPFFNYINVFSCFFVFFSTSLWNEKAWLSTGSGAMPVPRRHFIELSDG